MICMLVITSTLIMVKPRGTDAAFFVPAIPAAVKGAAGAAAIGGAIVGGVITGMALSEADINLADEVKRIWESLDSDVQNEWDIITDVDWNSNLIWVRDTPVYSNILDASIDAYYNINSTLTTTRVEANRILSTTYAGRLEFSFPENTYYFVMMHPVTGNYLVFRNLTLQLTGAGNVRTISARPLDIVMSKNSSEGLYGDLQVTREEWELMRHNTFTSTISAINYLNRGLMITTDINKGMVASIVSVEVWEEYIKRLTNIYDADFPLLNLDAISYPLNQVRPYVIEDNLRVPLEWNPALEDWVLPTNPDVPFTGELVWNIPQPRWYTDTAGNLRVGFPILDGSIMDALTGALINAPPLESDIPGSVDVPTGFFDSILSLVTALTTGLIGNLGDINWDKLKITANTLTTKFPFSIPWDIGNAFDSIFGSIDGSTAPSWDFVVAGQSYTIKIPDLLLEWFPIIRTMILIIFDISIIYAIRQWLGGAS